MTLTIQDISNRLKRMDEISVLEILEIDSEMLVDRFDDLIEEKADQLEEELEEQEEENEN